MFKNLYNLATLSVSLKPESALLVKGAEAPDPIAPDMAFIRMRTPKGNTVFIPGSSIKGVIRSLSEALLRSLPQQAGIPPICDASDPRTLCSDTQKTEKEKKEGKKLPYERHCLACRTFGSTDLAARVAFSDFMPTDSRVMDYLTERPGVSIDRKTGIVKHGPFQMEVLTRQGRFQGTITLTNYQLWQLGLVLWALDLMDEGVIKLGFAKSRGPGWVHPRVEKVAIRQFGPLAQAFLAGVGLVEEEQYRGLLRPEEDRLSVDVSPKTNGLWTEFLFENVDVWSPVAKRIKNHFSRIIGT